MVKAKITIGGKTYDEFPTQVTDDFGFTFTFNVKNNDNSVFDLTDHTAKFKARQYSSAVNQIDGNCVITDAENGVCTYTLGTSDLTVEGRFSTELELTNGTTSIQTAKLGDMTVVEDL